MSTVHHTLELVYDRRTVALKRSDRLRAIMPAIAFFVAGVLVGALIVGIAWLTSGSR
jgi:hypothetical protein